MNSHPIRLDEELTRAVDALNSAQSRVDEALYNLALAEADRDAAQARLDRLEELRSIDRDDEPPLSSIADKNRTDAIVDILRQHEGPMKINEVLDELHRLHDDDVKYMVVASTLNYLAKDGRIHKPSRGRYAAS